MRKIMYIANARLPTEKAHGLQIMKMCGALARQSDVTLTLLLPRRLNPFTDDPFSYFMEERGFPLVRLFCWDLISRAVWLGRLAYALEAVTFAWSVRRYISQQSAETIVYTRDLICLLFLPRRQLFFEIHNWPRSLTWWHKWLLRKTSKIVAITEALKNHLAALGYPADKIHVAPDAVDLAAFDIPGETSEWRERLGLPRDKKIIMYTGHLYSWKGASTLLEAAGDLPECVFVFVGGTDKDLVAFRSRVNELKFNNVIVVGHRPPADMPGYLKAADILVLPNSAKLALSSHYASPMKLFEYMAARRPLVASDLSALREVLDETTATFFTADDSRSLSQALAEVFQSYELAQKKSERAFQLVLARYTWDNRAKQIVNFIAGGAE